MVWIKKVFSIKYFVLRGVILVYLILNTLFLIQSVEAAKIFFEPAESTYEVGDSITVNVKLNTQGQNINAVDLSISYPPLLEVQSISKSGSIIQLWVQEPNYTNTGIFLSGGLPGGTSTSNGVIAKLTLKAKAIGDGGLQLTPASSVLLNDGEGTKASLNAGITVFHITPQIKKATENPAASPKKEPEKSPTPEPEKGKDKGEVEDKVKPQKFNILFAKDPRLFNGNDFISFFTVDSGSGVDHYEVKLGKSDFKIAQAPFSLEGLAPRTVIKVRAYDTEGNYRETIYPGLLRRIYWQILRIFGG